MKLLCNRGALLEALNMANTVAPARTSKPVLQCVKLTASDDRLTLSATDCDNSLQWVMSQVQIEEAGDTLLPCKTLLDIVRRSFDDTISIGADLASIRADFASIRDQDSTYKIFTQNRADFASIRDQDSTYKIFTQNGAEFPLVPGFEGDASFTIAGGELKRLISQTIFAVSKAELRGDLKTGALFEIKVRKISLIATDGCRLAQAKGDLLSDKLGKDGAKAIVPAKALALIDKLVDDPEEPVEFQIRENQVVFHTSRATLTSNLIEGKFPAYDVPKDTDKKMTAPTADFLGAIQKAELFVQGDNGVRCQFSKRGLLMTAHHFDTGDATINFPCRYEGPDIAISFRPSFLTEALNVIQSDEFTLEMTRPNRAGILRGGRNFLYAVMPVNLNE